MVRKRPFAGRGDPIGQPGYTGTLGDRPGRPEENLESHARHDLLELAVLLSLLIPVGIGHLASGAAGSLSAWRPSHQAPGRELPPPSAHVGGPEVTSGPSVPAFTMHGYHAVPTF